MPGRPLEKSSLTYTFFQHAPKETIGKFPNHGPLAIDITLDERLANYNIHIGECELQVRPGGAIYQFKTYSDEGSLPVPSSFLAGNIDTLKERVVNRELEPFGEFRRCFNVFVNGANYHIAEQQVLMSDCQFSE